MCLIAAMAVIQRPVFFAVAGIVQGHFSETVGVPLQQISAIAADESGSIGTEQAEFIDRVMPADGIAEAHDPEKNDGGG